MMTRDEQKGLLLTLISRFQKPENKGEFRILFSFIFNPTRRIRIRDSVRVSIKFSG